MFELDGDFDLDEDFLQGVFETETEAAKKIPGVGTKGEKRSSLEEEPCITIKKHKLTNNEHISQFKNISFEGRSKVSINSIKNNETETSGKLSSVQEMRGINLNAFETEVHPIRNGNCNQPNFRMQLDDRCSAFPNKCPDGSTPDVFESRVDTLSDGRNKYYGVAVSKETVRPAYVDVTPERCDRTGQTVRQRKFPGPAGLLPDKDHTTNRSTVPTPTADSEMLHNENLLCSQPSSLMFETAAWQQMLRDFELSDSGGPLSQFTVAWVKRRAAARQLLHQKVPFLVMVLRDLDCSSPDPCVILQDRTGEVHGTLHREVWEQYGGQLQPGAILVLRQVGVLSTGITARRHYLNVTCNNIINIYSNVLQDEITGKHSNNVRTTRVHQVSHRELLKSATDWLPHHSAPDTSVTCRPVNSVFSTVGSPAHLSLPHHALKQSGNIRGNASPLSSRPNGWQRTSSSVPNFVCGTRVPQTADRTVYNSINSKDNMRTENSLSNSVQIRKTNLQNAINMSDSSNGKSYASTIINSSTPFNRRVTDAAEQSVHGRSASYSQNVSDLPQQIQDGKLSDHEGFKFQPHLTPASFGRKVSDSLLHQSDERQIVGSEGFNFQPQPTLSLNSNRTDTVAPAFKGGFIPKVSRFGSSTAAVSQTSYSSQVPAIAGASFDVSNSCETSHSTTNEVGHLQESHTLSMSLNFGGESSVSSASGQYSSSESTSKSSECMTKVESSALDVLEGLDTNSLFDEF